MRENYEAKWYQRGPVGRMTVNRLPPVHRRRGRRRSFAGRAGRRASSICHSQSADCCSRRFERAVASGSPPDLHIYDYDWSPDDKMFVRRRAGPETNIGGSRRLRSRHREGNATSIYKPGFKSPFRVGRRMVAIAFMKVDERRRIHGGDLSHER